MMSEITCPLCYSRELVSYDEVTWNDGNDAYIIKGCSECGSAFTCPLPTDNFLINFYHNSFNYAWYEDHLYAKRKDSRIRFSEYKDFLGKSTLDYGGGLGYFSQTCRDNGIDSITYDPYKTESLGPKKWDSVVALHALEHSNNPDKFIGDIHSKLNDGGKLILAVPNFEGMGYKTYKMDWVWAQPPFLHIFHLTSDGISKLLRRNGFVNIEVSYHERWDANNYADVINRLKYAKRDALWAHKWVNKFKIFRKIIATINSILREIALNKAKKIRGKKIDYSELQIIATKG